MQNLGQNDESNAVEDVKTLDIEQASLTPSSPEMDKAQVLAAAIQQNFVELSNSEEDEVSEVIIVYRKSLSKTCADQMLDTE